MQEAVHDTKLFIIHSNTLEKFPVRFPTRLDERFGFQHLFCKRLNQTAVLSSHHEAAIPCLDLRDLRLQGDDEDVDFEHDFLDMHSIILSAVLVMV